MYSDEPYRDLAIKILLEQTEGNEYIDAIGFKLMVTKNIYII